MTDESSPAEYFDTIVTLGSITHLAALSRSADQLRWASHGVLQNIHREAMPPSALVWDREVTYSDPTTPEGQERSNRESHHHGLIWVSLTSILNSAAKISDLLWGAGHEATRESIRNILRQPHDKKDAVIGEKAFRNHFEHQDERLLKFLKTQRSGLGADAGRAFAERIILPEAARAENNGFFASTSLFWWAPDVDKLWYLDEELDMRRLVSEVINIGEIASKMRGMGPDQLLNGLVS